MNNNRFTYFFLGLGLGTAAGLLFAPKAGADTRDYLRSRAQDGADYLKSQGQEAMDGVNDMVERGKQTLQTQIKNVADAVDSGKQAYREAVATPSMPRSV